MNHRNAGAPSGLPRLLSLTLVLGAALAAPGLRAASPADEPSSGKTGRARLVAPVEKSGSGEIQVPVTIDLSNVTIDGKPGVLGAYVVAVAFDPKKVAYVGVDRGSAPEFNEAPSGTPPEKANSLGLVKVVGDQGRDDAPTGAVSVAVIRFRELSSGGASTIKPRVDSLASALRRDAAGHIVMDLKIPVETDN